MRKSGGNGFNVTNSKRGNAETSEPLTNSYFFNSVVYTVQRFFPPTPHRGIVCLSVYPSVCVIKACPVILQCQ
jgi:hypothetical protein